MAYINKDTVKRYWKMMECSGSMDFEHDLDIHGVCKNCKRNILLYQASFACSCTHQDIRMASSKLPYFCEHGVEWYEQDNGPTTAYKVAENIAEPFAKEFHQKMIEALKELSQNKH